MIRIAVCSRTVVLSMLCALMLALTGCVTGPTNQNPVTVNSASGFPPSKSLTVGILSFNSKKPGWGRTVADSMAAALIDVPGVDVVDRSVVERALAGRRQTSSDVIAGNWKPFVSDTGIDALLLGSVTEWALFHDYYNNEGASVSFNARIVDIRTGKVLAGFDCAQEQAGLGRPALAKELAEQAAEALKKTPLESPKESSASSSAQEEVPFESDIMDKD